MQPFCANKQTSADMTQVLKAQAQIQALEINCQVKCNPNTHYS